MTSPAPAQFLRLGIFNLSAQAKLDAIYTTNVEGQRKSQAEKEMEDFYLVPALSLAGRAPFGRNTQLTLDTALGMEKHFVRTDLDSESAPFGRVRVDSRSELGRYTLGLYGGVERSLEEKESIYVPAGKKTRDPTDTYEWGGDLGWEWRSLRLRGSYEGSNERHLNADFLEGDKDEITMSFQANLQLRRDLIANYAYERSRTEMINDPADRPTWDSTETLSLDWNLPLWKRPVVTYSLGVERETRNGVAGDWELTHTVSVNGDWEVFPRAGAFRLSLNAAYQYEKNPEEDDIAFTYGAELRHEISRTARQEVRFKREPVETFGSKNDTDSTSVDYQFTKDDLFIYNLRFTASLGWERNQPMERGSPTEKILKSGMTLAHTRNLSRKLARRLMYEYTWEDSNLEVEPLVEHRVTWSLTYSFQ